MNSKEFNKTVVQEAINELGRILCKLEHDREYDIAPEADQIISQCMDDLKYLVKQ